MILLYNPFGFYTLFKRETMRYIKIYGQTILAPLLTNVLFLTVFGAMFKTREVGIDGVSYLSFLVPGLCAMGAIMNAFQNPSSSLIIQKYQNLIQDLNTFPISTFEKVFAYILAGAFRGLAVGVLTYVATIYFVGFHIAQPILFFFMLFIVSYIFSGIGVILGLTLDNFDRLGFFLNIILTPLIYLGGVFFQVSRLPGILSKIAMFNPLFPLIDIVRFTYIGVHEGNILVNLLFVLIILISVTSISYYCFASGYGMRD